MTAGPEQSAIDQDLRLEAIASSLRATGLSVVDWPELPWPALAAEAQALQQRGALQAAATGRGSGRQHHAVRGDSTAWIDPATCGPATAHWLAAMDTLRTGLNRRLLLGLEELEAHFACYPPGAGYARHRDRFSDDDARVLSLVCYLNVDWPDGAGGALRLHLGEGARDVPPRMGTVVLFLSDEVEHEVLPADRPRWSLAGWFRRRPRLPR